MSAAPLMTMRFSLPWPPSVNTYWTHAVLGGKYKKARATVFLSDAGKKYRTAALLSLKEQRVPVGAVKGRLRIHVVAYPPDARVRDLDNIWKGMLDSLKHSGVIEDDGDFDWESIERGPVRKGGMICVELSELGAIVCVQPALDLREPVSAAPPF